MSEYDFVDLTRREPGLRARLPFLCRKRPLIPVPEVTLLLDRNGHVVRQSARHAGELLQGLPWAQSLTVHDAFHTECVDPNCEFLRSWRSAWKAHNAGLPVEWLFLSDVSPAVVKLRLQPVSYACQMLFGADIDRYSDHSVLFIQDLAGLSANDDAPARQENVRNAVLYERRRDDDTDPDLVASLDDRLREQTRKLLDVDAHVRCRLAQELHDSLGQTLSMLRIEIESAASNQISADVCGSLDRIVKQVKHGQRELRGIIDNLRDQAGRQLALRKSLSALAADFRNAMPNIDLQTEFDIEESDLSAEVAVAAYRIIQEALHNVARHSGAASASISMTQNSEGVSMVVTDNGRGLPEDVTCCNGLGLTTMRKRAERLGGKFEIDCAATGGCTIRVAWPATVVAQLT